MIYEYFQSVLFTTPYIYIYIHGLISINLDMSVYFHKYLSDLIHQAVRMFREIVKWTFIGLAMYDQESGISKYPHLTIYVHVYTCI